LDVSLSITNLPVKVFGVKVGTITLAGWIFGVGGCIVGVAGRVVGVGGAEQATREEMIINTKMR